jgi:hypothetical protein
MERFYKFSWRFMRFMRFMWFYGPVAAHATSETDTRRLWEVSEELTGVNYPASRGLPSECA